MQKRLYDMGTLHDTVPAQTVDKAQLIANFRANIQTIEAQMKATPGAFEGDNDLCPLTHRFADNQYIREIFIPAGTIIVGKIHRHSHCNFISKGRVLVATEQGGIEELIAPLTIISPAGTKRLVYALEDTVWTTIHVTDKTDIAEIEKEIITEDYESLPQVEGGQSCPGLLSQS